MIISTKGPEMAKQLRAALDARGLAIVKKETTNEG